MFILVKERVTRWCGWDNWITCNRSCTLSDHSKRVIETIHWWLYWKPTESIQPTSPSLLCEWNRFDWSTCRCCTEKGNEKNSFSISLFFSPFLVFQIITSEWQTFFLPSTCLHLFNLLTLILYSSVISLPVCLQLFLFFCPIPTWLKSKFFPNLFFFSFAVPNILQVSGRGTEDWQDTWSIFSSISWM